MRTIDIGSGYPIGNTLCQCINVTYEEAVKVLCPRDCYLYIFDNQERVYLETNSSIVLGKNKGFFRRNTTSSYSIYILNRKMLTAKGFVQIEARDNGYHDVSTTLKIPFDYSVQVCVSKCNEVVTNLFSKYATNGRPFTEYRTDIEPLIRDYVANVISQYIASKGIDSCIDNKISISSKIVEYANSSSSKLYNYYGLQLCDVSFNVMREESLEAEKRRVERNKAIMKERY